MRLANKRSRIGPAKPARPVHLMLKDVDVSKFAEGALQQKPEDLRRLATVVSDSNDAVIMHDFDGKILAWNRGANEAYGYSEAEALEMNVRDIVAEPDRDAALNLIQRIKQGEIVKSFELRRLAQDGRILDVWLTTTLLRDQKGKPVAIATTERDITGRKRVEQALAESETRFKWLYEYAPVAYHVLTPEGTITDVNRRWCELLGYRQEEAIGKAIFDLVVEEEREAARASFQKKKQSRQPYVEGSERNFRTKAGAVRTFKTFDFFGLDEGQNINSVHTTIEDITDRKRAEAQIHYQAALLESVNDAIVASDAEYRITAWNAAAEALYGWKAAEVLGRNGLEVIRTEWPGVNPEEMRRHIAGTGHWRGEATQARKDGTRIPVELSSMTLHDESGQITGYVSANRDITDRKRAELALRDSEKKLRTLFASMTDVVIVYDADGRYLEIAPTQSVNLKLPASEMLGKTVSDLFPPDEARFFLDHIRQALKTGQLGNAEYRLRFGEQDRWFSAAVSPLSSDSVIWVAHDITVRRQAETALRESEQLYRTLVDTSPDAITVSDLQGKLILCSRQTARLHGYASPEAMQGLDAFELIAPEDREKALTNARTTLTTGILRNAEYTMLRKDGSRFPADLSAALLPDAEGNPRAFIALIRDVTERKRSEEKIQRQLEHLTALSEIERAIASTLDLRLSLSTLLSHIIKEPIVDAADVLVLDPVTQMLEYAAGSGFRTNALQHTHLPLGQGYAGLAGLERQTIHIANLRTDTTDSAFSRVFKTEEFETYFGLPLIAKGRLLGVLEVFRRTPSEPDPEWLDFLNTLAGQAAIAIDNARLFDGLQRSNVDLSLAYEATIAGWSHALDLRDKETEGHTQRVMDMALSLARLFGLRDEELVHVRRGALLHDIGKMGVPDGILLKPGPLTADEWVVMKKHPAFAYEMLSPIQYLHSAIDIPYCHHEKWDGTGYPRGLKGDQIPLAARLFAVVDVWDALTSDRPYRRAWTQEKALEYVRTQAGAHFDPTAVELFLRLNSEKPPIK